MRNPSKGVRFITRSISSVQTVFKSKAHKILLNDSAVCLVKLKAKPSLRPHHKEAKCKWAERFPKRVRRRFRGGSNTIWDRFTGEGLRCFIRVEGKLYALRYEELLEKNLVPKLPKEIEGINKLIFIDMNKVAAGHFINQNLPE